MLKISATAACSLGDLRPIAAELEGLLGVRQPLLPTVASEVLLAALHERLDQSADQVLSPAVAPQIRGLD